MQREFEKYKERINLAGNTDFDELSSKDLTPTEMDESMLGMVNELEPTKEDFGSGNYKKYSITEDGKKIRKDKNRKEKAEKKRK